MRDAISDRFKLNINDCDIALNEKVKYLSAIIDCDLSFTSHVTYMSEILL